MPTERRARGDQVEAAALELLLSHGLARVAGNVLYRAGELDLVMRDGGTLVFVEVRYRASDAFGGAAASVTPAKRRRMVRAAGLFLAANPAMAHLPCRFDVVAAGGDPRSPRMEWLRDAFRADD